MKIVSHLERLQLSQGENPIENDLHIDKTTPACTLAEEYAIRYTIRTIPNKCPVYSNQTVFAIVENWRGKYSLIQLPKTISGYFKQYENEEYDRLITENGLIFSTIAPENYSLIQTAPPNFNKNKSFVLHRRLSFLLIERRVKEMAKAYDSKLPNDWGNKLYNLEKQLEQGRQQIVKWEQELTQKEHPIVARIPFSKYFL